LTLVHGAVQLWGDGEGEWDRRRKVGKEKGKGVKEDR
jgi:hypothetical protein